LSEILWELACLLKEFVTSNKQLEDAPFIGCAIHHRASRLTKTGMIC
jgi:hypothetical protein